MAFTPKSWQNSPNTTTPLNAAALVDMETRLAAYSDSLAVSSTPIVVLTAAAYAALSPPAANTLYLING